MRIGQLWGESVKFLKEVRSELLKVVWPKYTEFVGSTIIALIIIAAFSCYLWIVDRFFYTIASKIF